MRAILTRALFAPAAWLVGAGHALAASPVTAEAAPLTSREAFLAAVLGAIVACGTTSFFLAGRVSERTHVALAMLIVLIAAFGLFGLFGLAGRETPLVGAFVVLGLMALFKLMNQCEIRRDRERPRR